MNGFSTINYSQYSKPNTGWTSRLNMYHHCQIYAVFPLGAIFSTNVKILLRLILYYLLVSALIFLKSGSLLSYSLI